MKPVVKNKKHTERYESDFSPVTSSPKSPAQSYLLRFLSSLLSTSRNGRAIWHRGFVPHGPYLIGLRLCGSGRENV